MMKKVLKFNKELCKINYGWYDAKGVLHESLKDGNFVSQYRLQDSLDVKKHKSAICWDLCEVEREFFKENGYQFITVFAVLKKMKRNPCHTFLVFKEDNFYYWFEASWRKMKGVRKYETLDSLFDDVRKHFDEFTKTKDYNKEDIEFYKYNKPRRGCSCNGFYMNCLYFGKKIRKDSKRLFR